MAIGASDGKSPESPNLPCPTKRGLIAKQESPIYQLMKWDERKTIAENPSARLVLGSRRFCLAMGAFGMSYVNTAKTCRFLLFCVVLALLPLPSLVAQINLNPPNELNPGASNRPPQQSPPSQNSQPTGVAPTQHTSSPPPQFRTSNQPNSSNQPNYRTAQQPSPISQPMLASPRSYVKSLHF